MNYFNIKYNKTHSNFKLQFHIEVTHSELEKKNTFKIEIVFFRLFCYTESVPQFILKHIFETIKMDSSMGILFYERLSF